MNYPVLVRMRLLQALRLGDRLHLAGTTIEVGVDTAAHLLHQRRAVLVNEADLGVLHNQSPCRR